MFSKDHRNWYLYSLAAIGVSVAVIAIYFPDRFDQMKQWWYVALPALALLARLSILGAVFYQGARDSGRSVPGHFGHLLKMCLLFIILPAIVVTMLIMAGIYLLVPAQS